MRTRTVVSAAAVAGVLWAAVLAGQQEMKERPGPGSGITNVTGAVSITNTPAVLATQQGEWTVAVNNVPGVRIMEIPSPGFLRAGYRYEITWTDGGTDTVLIESISGNGWVEVERGRRWVNVLSARSIRDVR
jgi:hypothetical protein